MAEKKLAGVLGFFADDNATLEAMRKVKQSSFKSVDAYTPYPIHGMDQAQGIKRSAIPYVTFLAGLTGFAAAFGLEYWTSAVDWPLIVGGKPFNSWPAFVPIMFELTVLFAGLATFGALVLFCKLPNTTKRAFDPSITCDRFAILIEATAKAGEKFDEAHAADVLKKAGAEEVRTVYQEGWF